jgi:hypothetical protein
VKWHNLKYDECGQNEEETRGTSGKKGEGKPTRPVEKNVWEVCGREDGSILFIKRCKK